MDGDASAPATAPVPAPPASDKATDFPLISMRKLEAAMEALEHGPTPPAEHQKATMAELKQSLTEHLLLEDEYRHEWNALKHKYQQKFAPLYEKRRELLVSAPMGAVELLTPGAAGTPSLPGFWLKAMQNHLLLAEMIERRDAEILEYLQDISFEWLNPDEQTSFKIMFTFARNPFFENDVLTKQYNLERADDDDEEAVLVSSVGTEIKWRVGRNVTEKTVARRQRNKRTNQVRTVTQVVEQTSFFNFFQSHEIPTEDELEGMGERDVSELEMIVEAEYEVGCIIRDKLVPRAFGWYLGIERDTDVDSDVVSDGDHNFSRGEGESNITDSDDEED